MDIKTALQHIDLLISDAAFSEEQIRAVKTATDRYGEIKKHIKSLKEDKQAINSQFKQAKGDTDRIAVLKQQSKDIALTIKSAESDLKAVADIIIGFFDSEKAAESTWPPARFLIQQQEEAPFQYTIRQATDNDADLWDAFVANHPNASAYHLYAWSQVIAQSFGHQNFYFLAESENNEIVGIFPCTWLNSRLFGSFGASVPFFNYGGPLSYHKDIESELIQAASLQAENLHWRHLEIRTCRDDFNLPVTQHKASMILSLPDTEEQLDQALGAKVRAQFKQANKCRLSVKFGKAELLDDYYHVFAINMRDLGTPVYSKQFFKRIFEYFSEQATIVVVYLNGKPAATGFLFGFKDMLEIPWASTIRRYNRYNVNMWMYRQILGYAIAKSYAYFDFGRSSIDAGTYKFKKQWGAQPILHYWYYWLNQDQHLPQMNPDNPKFKLAISVWQKLPVFITKIIGPPIVKNIS